MRLSIAFLLAFLSASALPAGATDEKLPDRENFLQASRLDAEEHDAYRWSIGGTLVPLAAAIWIGGITNGSHDLAMPLFILGTTALTVGPSMGQFKAGSIGHGVAASALRGAGEAVAFVAFIRSLCIMCDADIAASKPSPTGGLLAGAALYLAGTVYSLANIHHTYEAKRESTLSTLRIAPTLALGRENRFRPGMLATLRF